MEDVVYGYGYDNLKKTKPKAESLVAAPLPVNKVADILRLASSQAGYLEVMPLTLSSHDENFAWLKRRMMVPKAVKWKIQRQLNTKLLELLYYLVF